MLEWDESGLLLAMMSALASENTGIGFEAEESLLPLIAALEQAQHVAIGQVREAVKAGAREQRLARRGIIVAVYNGQ